MVTGPPLRPKPESTLVTVPVPVAWQPTVPSWAIEEIAFVPVQFPLTRRWRYPVSALMVTSPGPPPPMSPVPAVTFDTAGTQPTLPVSALTERSASFAPVQPPFSSGTWNGLHATFPASPTACIAPLASQRPPTRRWITDGSTPSLTFPDVPPPVSPSVGSMPEIVPLPSGLHEMRPLTVTKRSASPYSQRPFKRAWRIFASESRSRLLALISPLLMSLARSDRFFTVELSTESFGARHPKRRTRCR